MKKEEVFKIQQEILDRFTFNIYSFIHLNHPGLSEWHKKDILLTIELGKETMIDMIDPFNKDKKDKKQGGNNDRRQDTERVKD